MCGICSKVWLINTTSQLLFFKFTGFDKDPVELITYLFKKFNGYIHISLGMTTRKEEKKIFELAKKFKDAGATIIGGCCETRPAHIEAFSKLK